MGIASKNQKIILVSFFTALTAVGAFMKIPLPHVPITLQTFIVLMAGNLLGYKFGSISQLLYVMLGLVGIPIFAYGGGPAYIFQPSFGYLLGYPLCAFFIGLLIKKIDSKISFHISRTKYFVGIIISDIIGIFVIFICGLSYLYFNIKFGLYLRVEEMTSSLNWGNALKTAFFVFIPLDLIKVLLAGLLTMKLKHIRLFDNSMY